MKTAFREMLSRTADSDSGATRRGEWRVLGVDGGARASGFLRRPRDALVRLSGKTVARQHLAGGEIDASITGCGVRAVAGSIELSAHAARFHETVNLLRYESMS